MKQKLQIRRLGANRTKNYSLEATVNTETCEALGLDFETVKAAMEPLCTQVNEITTAESFDELEEN